MPLNLVKPVDVGVIGTTPGTQVKIVRWTHDVNRECITISFNYGHTDAEGNWVRGPTPAGKKSTLTFRGQQCRDFIAANQTLYDQVKTVLYTKLLDDEVVDEGTIS